MRLAELDHTRQHRTDCFCLCGAGLVHVNVVVGINHQPFSPKAFDCGRRAAQDRIQRTWLISVRFDEHKMLADPFKRRIPFRFRHPFFAIEESFLAVDFHQAADVNLGLILKRADRKLPIAVLSNVDHELINEV